MPGKAIYLASLLPLLSAACIGAESPIYDFQGQQFTVSWTAKVGPVQLVDSGTSAVAHITFQNLDTGVSFMMPTLGGQLGYAGPGATRERILDFFAQPGVQTYSSVVTNKEIPNGRIRISSDTFGGLTLLVGPDKGWTQEISVLNAVPNLPRWNPPGTQPTNTDRPIWSSLSPF